MELVEQCFQKNLSISGRKRKRGDVDPGTAWPAVSPKQAAIDFSSKWFTAIRHNRVYEVCYMLRGRRIDPNIATVHQITAVFWCCAANRTSILRHLLADPRVDVNRMGACVTPLTIAVIAGHPSAAALMLAHPEIDISVENKDGSTALTHAVKRLAHAQKIRASARELRNRAQILALVYDAISPDRVILNQIHK